MIQRVFEHPMVVNIPKWLSAWMYQAIDGWDELITAFVVIFSVFRTVQWGQQNTFFRNKFIKRIENRVRVQVCIRENSISSVCNISILLNLTRWWILNHIWEICVSRSSSLASAKINHAWDAPRKLIDTNLKLSKQASLKLASANFTNFT
jgi:hypothetical protein